MNYLAVVVVGVLHFVLAMIWYSPAVFGKRWMKLSGVKKMGATPAALALGLLSSLVMAFVLGQLVSVAKVGTLLDGALVGFMAWAGFIATLSLGGVLWKNEPPQLYFLNNVFNVLALIIMGAILAIWA